MKTKAILIICLLALGQLGIAQKATSKDHFKDAELLVRELYDLVTLEAGQTPDWDQVKSLFIKEAVIVLRTSRDSMTIFSVDSFVEDFQNFIARANVEKTGFVEKIIRVKPMVFGDTAQMLVLYEASIPGTSRTPQQGVDNILLIHQSGRWWITSIINELPGPENPLPPELKEP